MTMFRTSQLFNIHVHSSCSPGEPVQNTSEHNVIIIILYRHDVVSCVRVNDTVWTSERAVCDENKSVDVHVPTYVPCLVIRVIYFHIASLITGN